MGLNEECWFGHCDQHSCPVLNEFLLAHFHINISLFLSLSLSLFFFLSNFHSFSTIQSLSQSSFCCILLKFFSIYSKQARSECLNIFLRKRLTILSQVTGALLIMQSNVNQTSAHTHSNRQALKHTHTHFIVHECTTDSDTQTHTHTHTERT